MSLFQRLVGSFDTTTKGAFAARKLTAFAFVLLAFYIHYKYVDKTNAIEALTIDCLMVLLMLSIVTFEQIVQLKNGKKDEPPTT